MFRRMLLGVCSVVMLASVANSARSAEPPLPRFYYYPYYYYPHSYWPSNSPKWPEAPGMPYQRPPAYMAYPPFQERNWHYMLFESHRYYKGNHFWLDQF